VEGSKLCLFSVIGSKLCLFSVIMPAKCVFIVSPRFHYRRLAFCFLPLAAILESLLSAIFLPQPSDDGVLSSPGKVGSPTTVLFTARVSSCLKFSLGPCQMLSFPTTNSHGCLPHRHCGKVSQVFLSHDCSLVPAHKLAQSQKTCSQVGVLTALRDEVSDRMSFVTEGSLPHWSSHCLTKFTHLIKTCRYVSLSCT
jgi:hypothetical protein